MKACLYSRVSTLDKGQDTENQLIELREFAARSGWSVTKEYVDHESGKHGDRVQLQAMLKDATRRKFDAVVVWALDRLTREGIEKTFAYVRQLKDCGVQFISFTEPQFRTTGPAGDLLISIAAWIAEQERRRISERTKAGLVRVRASGKRLGRPQVAVDINAVRQLRNEGLGCRRIAERLGLKRSVVYRALVSLGLAHSEQSSSAAAEVEQTSESDTFAVVAAQEELANSAAPAAFH